MVDRFPLAKEMKLTIDTESDSKEDLRKVIRFLQLMVNERDFRNLEQRRQMEDRQEGSMATFFDQVDKKDDDEPSPQPAFKLDFF
ncbi:hypothetical protein GF342_03675 [Candidatus Woesearchaeota archaeon]|nr:hypothetical protein [Candidatus Woesearchaeota archaeon]